VKFLPDVQLHVQGLGWEDNTQLMRA